MIQNKIVFLDGLTGPNYSIDFMKAYYMLVSLYIIKFLYEIYIQRVFINYFCDKRKAMINIDCSSFLRDYVLMNKQRFSFSIWKLLRQTGITAKNTTF